MLTVTLPQVWFHRILHAQRDVEIALRLLNHHDPSPGLEEVRMRVAALRFVIERAVEAAMKSET